MTEAVASAQEQQQTSQRSIENRKQVILKDIAHTETFWNVRRPWATGNHT